MLNLPIPYSLNIHASSGRSLQYTPALLHSGVLAFPCSSVTSGSLEMESSRSIRRSVSSLLPPRALIASQRMPQSVQTGDAPQPPLSNGSYIKEIVPAAVSGSIFPSKRLLTVSMARCCSELCRYLSRRAASAQASIDMLVYA